MPNFVGFLSILTDIALVSASSLGLITIRRVRGIVANVLAFAVTTYVTIVLLAQILSELNAMHWQGFLIGHAIIVLILLPWLLKKHHLSKSSLLKFFSLPKIQFKQWIVSNPALTVLGTSVFASILLGVYLILVVPPNIWDSLSYHLPRIVNWIQNGSMHRFETSNLKQNAFPINAEIGSLWAIILWGNDLLGGFIQWFATILTTVGIYGIARRLRFSQPASLFAALIWSTFTIVVLHSTSTKNDTLVAFFFLPLFIFYWSVYKMKHKKIRCTLSYLVSLWG